MCVRFAFREWYLRGLSLERYLKNVYMFIALHSYHCLIMEVYLRTSPMHPLVYVKRERIEMQRIDLLIPFQDRDDTPPPTILRTFISPLRHPFPTNLATIFIMRDDIPFEDPINFESILDSSFKELGDDLSTCMEPGNYPHMATRSEEPLHRASDILVLSLHPIAISCYDASKSSLVLQGEGIVQDTPFVRFDADGRWGSWRAIGQIMIHVELNCAFQCGGGRVVCCNDV